MRPLALGIRLLAIVSLMTVAAAYGGELPPRTLLAVFAHPDDETVVMPLLSRYARQGVRVYLAFATDGSKGTASHAAVPAGSQLARVRAEESRCAAAQLGIEPPIFIGLEDGGLTRTAAASALHAAIERLLDELHPNAVVTWGPGGGSGHTDHRMVSNVVTEVIQNAAPQQTDALFFVGFPRDAVESLPQFSSETARWQRRNLHAAQRRHLPVRISYDPVDRQATQNALNCYRSQFSPRVAEELLEMMEWIWRGTVHLRSWNGCARTDELL